MCAYSCVVIISLQIRPKCQNSGAYFHRENILRKQQKPVTVSRAFAKNFKVLVDHDRKTITRLIKKFEHTTSVCDNMHPNVNRKATVSTTDIVERTREVSPRKSIRRAAQEVGIKIEKVYGKLSSSNRNFFRAKSSASTIECGCDYTTIGVCK